MQILTPNLLRELATCDTPICVSLYMEMSAGGGNHDEIRIALKNAKSSAHDALAAADGDADAVAAVKQRLESLSYDDVAGGHDRRVAVFIAPNLTRIVDARFDETSVHVGTSFRLAPLVADLAHTPDHAVLVASSDRACLYRTVDGVLQEQAVTDMPKSLSEISQFTDQQEKGNIHGREDSGIPASYRGGPVGPSGPAGPAGVSHHSMGGHDWRDDQEQDMRSYANAVINAVQQHLSGTDVPLIIAADERLYGMLHAYSKYPFLLQEGITQHPDSLDEKELATKAAAHLKGEVEKLRNAAWDKVAISLGRGDNEASADPVVILTAAATGRVSHLFVQGDARLQGHFDMQGPTVDLTTDGPENLIDRAIIETLRNGGEVFPLQDRADPETHVVAAFRYPV